MKKNIQKIISVLFGFAFLFVAQTSYAAVSWNSASSDCAGLRIANYTTNQGYGTCWSLSSVQANAGDTINVRLYYHNNGDQTATNVRLVLNAPTINSASTSHSFSGSLSSDQGSISLGSVNVNLGSSQKLTFNSATWYPNQNQSTISQGSSIINGGLNIGSVAPGWSTQGTVVVVFKVDNYTPQTQYCPSGTTGTYPNCTPIVTSCPTGMIGTYPNCTWPQQYCPSGYTGTYPNCTPIIREAMSGSLSSSVSQCRINVNESSCPIRFSWQTSLPESTSAVTADDGSTVGTGNNNAGLITIPYGTHIYRLYNNTKLLDSESVMASCATGTSWNGSVCASSYNPIICGYGTVLSGGICVPIQQNTCSIQNFTINGYSSAQVSYGASANLNWNTTGCTSVNISNANGYAGTSGNQTVYPYGNTTYTLTAYGPNGYSDTRTVTAYTNQYNNQCTISYFNASPTSISAGGSSYLSWSTNNCSNVSISNLGNNLASSGSQTVYPSSSTNYTLTAYGNNGSPSQSVYISVANNPVYYNNTCATTNNATSISENSAQLNGNVNGGNGNSYFEYGTTTGFGNRTNTRLAYGSNTYTETITGLQANTVYYYRLISNCSNGQSVGNTQFFKTNGATVIDRVIRTFVPQRVVEVAAPVTPIFTNTIGTVSPLMLEITNKYEGISEGDIIDYTIKYKNIGNSVLTKPLLQVIVPSGITLTNASGNGSYLNADKTLSFQLADIYPGQEGVVYAQGKVDNIVPGDAKIVSKALLVYTTPNNTQENAIAYVTNVPKDYNGNVLGAAAFFGGLFSIGIIGWLLLIILILVLILLVRSYMRNVGAHKHTYGDVYKNDGHH